MTRGFSWAVCLYTSLAISAAGRDVQEWAGGLEGDPGSPHIITPPQDAAITNQECVSLSVVVSGDTPFGYQWFLGESGDSSAPVAGATNRTFTTPPLSADAQYWVRVENVNGVAYSRAASIRQAFAVWTLADLQKIGSGVDGWSLNAAYALMADIDASASASWNDADTDESLLEGFAPIGKPFREWYDDVTQTWLWEDAVPFEGLLDGRGHLICGLTLNRPHQEGVALFGCLGTAASVLDVALVNGVVIGNRYVGTIAGWNDGRVSGCLAAPRVLQGDDAGGVVGSHFGSLTRSCALGRVSGDAAGGLVGASGGEVAYCYAAARCEEDAGGLAGAFFDGCVTNSYWDTDASGQSQSAGGEARSAEAMRHADTFVGWDFEETWDIQEGDGAPFLRRIATGRTSHMTAPDGLSPDGMPPVVRVRPALTAEVASAACGLVNARWQVASSGSFDTPSDWFELACSTNQDLLVASAKVPVSGALRYGSNYVWRVRTQSAYGVWSAWSATDEFSVEKPVDPLASGRDTLGVWLAGLEAGLWPSFYLANAEADFAQAVAADGADLEARIGHALSRLMTLAENEPLRALLGDFGFTFDESAHSVTGAFSGTVAPPSNDAVDRLAASVLPELETALADLAEVPLDWSDCVTVAPDDFPVDEPVAVDAGDVLGARAAISGIRALLLTAKAYDMTADYSRTNVTVASPAVPLLSVTPDGDETEWAGVQPRLFGDRSLIEYVKTARSEDAFYTLLRLREGEISDFMWCEVETAAGTVWCGFDGYAPGATVSDWNGWATLCCSGAGDVLEIVCPLPPGADGQPCVLDEAFVQFSLPPVLAPYAMVTVDGFPDEWAGVPVALANWDDGRLSFVKISGDGDNVQVLVVLKDGYSFSGMQDLYASVMVAPGWGFSVSADTPGFSLQANENVLEFSAPVPIEYQGQDFYLNGVEFTLPDGESGVVLEGVFFQSADWDDVVEEEPLQPLASFMQDHPAALNAVRDPASLAMAREAVRLSLEWALAADAAITGRTDTAMHFIEYDPAETNEQAEVRQRLAEARAPLDAPQSITVDGHTRTVLAGAFFAMPYLTRAHVPSLTDDDEIVLGSFADPTMAGILPDMNQATWQDDLLGEWPVVQTNAFAMDGYGFTAGGYALWQLAAEVGEHEEVAVSGLLTDSTVAWVETAFTGPGTLTFSWAVSSRARWNLLSVYVDGVRQTGSLWGEEAWGPRSLSLPAGAHTVRWAYVKNDNATMFMDGGALDMLEWVSSQTATTTTPVAVPYAWLDGFEGLVSGNDYESAASGDPDQDGRLTWQEYVAGSNPIDGSSVFLATIDEENGQLTVGWTPDLGPARVYTVEGRSALNDSGWAPTNGASRFFRVKVQLP